MFFTATWPREVQQLAREFLRNPVEIKFGDTNSLNANKAIKQVVMVISEGDKSSQLNVVLDQINPSTSNPKKVEDCPKTIIFVSRKHVSCVGIYVTFYFRLYKRNYSCFA